MDSAAKPNISCKEERRTRFRRCSFGNVIEERDKLRAALADAALAVREYFAPNEPSQHFLEVLMNAGELT